MLHRLTITFAPTDENNTGLHRRDILAKSLHGLMFKTVLPAYSSEATDWLHEHEVPKPFALRPNYKNGLLEGMTVTTWSEPAAELMAAGWQKALTAQTILKLGPFSFRAAGLNQPSPTDFMALISQTPQPELRLRFITPTAFRQGPLRLHLPLPVNVFARPFFIWQVYSPKSLRLPDDWLDWCEQNVMVKFHSIRTVTVRFSRQVRYIGFVGNVTFEARSDDETYLQLWPALAGLATFCGVGYKTTMGMGAVAMRSGKKS